MQQKIGDLRRFRLPQAIASLVEARNGVRDHYRQVILERGCDAALKFTLDGNLVGDIGEAIAVELFGIALVNRASAEGIDGYARDGKTVQIKASGTGRGPAFRCTETRAHYLLFFHLDFEAACGEVIFNGPEHYVTDRLPKRFSGQRMIPLKQVRNADGQVKPGERLGRLDMA